MNQERPTLDELRVDGANVYRWDGSTWLLHPPLGLSSRPNLSQLRRDWDGRFVLIVHPDPDRPTDHGFVDSFVMVAGQVVVMLDLHVRVPLDRHSTMAHDPHGRRRFLLHMIDEAATRTTGETAAKLRERAVTLRDRGAADCAAELDRAADQAEGTAIPVTPTTLGFLR